MAQFIEVRLSDGNRMTLNTRHIRWVNPVGDGGLCRLSIDDSGEWDIDEFYSVICDKLNQPLMVTHPFTP